MKSVAPVRGLLAQVRPFFLVPAVAVSGFGGLLSPDVSVLPGILHASAVGAAVYVAHTRDNYVDYYVRGEDDRASLSEREARRVVLVASVVFLSLLVALWRISGETVALLTAPLWVLAIAHAPYLDMHPVTVTIDYPIGIALSILGGFAAQAGAVTSEVSVVAVVYFLVLAGCKVFVDDLDYEGDLAESKPTVPVVVGREGARWIGASIVGLGAGVLIVSAIAGPFDGPVAAAGFVPLVALAASIRRPALHPSTALALSMYPFTAVLFGALLV